MRFCQTSYSSYLNTLDKPNFCVTVAITWSTFKPILTAHVDNGYHFGVFL